MCIYFQQYSPYSIYRFRPYVSYEYTLVQTVLSDVVSGSDFNNAYSVTKLLATWSAGRRNLCYKVAYLVH